MKNCGSGVVLVATASPFPVTVSESATPCSVPSAGSNRGSVPAPNANPVTPCHAATLVYVTRSARAGTAASTAAATARIRRHTGYLRSQDSRGSDGPEQVPAPAGHRVRVARPLVFLE